MLSRVYMLLNKSVFRGKAWIFWTATLLIKPMLWPVGHGSTVFWEQTHWIPYQDH